MSDQEPKIPVNTEPCQRPSQKRQDRTVYTREQLQVLEAHFQISRYVDYEERQALADKIGVERHQVQVWFKNRRAKCTREQRQQGKQPQSARRGRRHSNLYPPVPADISPVAEPTGGSSPDQASPEVYTQYPWAEGFSPEPWPSSDAMRVFCGPPDISVKSEYEEGTNCEFGAYSTEFNQVGVPAASYDPMRR